LSILSASSIYSKRKVELEREAPVIPLHPFDEEIREAKELPTQNGRNRFKWVSSAAIFVATIVSIGSVYFLSDQINNKPENELIVRQEAAIVPVHKNELNTQSITPSKASEIPAKNETIQNEITTHSGLDTNPEKGIEIMPAAELISSSKSKYYVVAGSFLVNSKSKSLKQNLKSRGYKSDVLPKNENGMHRVVIGTFSDKVEAINLIKQHQDKFDEHLWVLTLD
jgi:cell division septation protein DedD